MTAARNLKNPGQNPRNRKPFSRAAKASVLAAGLAALSGCGDTINNHFHYYDSPDAGQTDSGKEEPSGKQMCSRTVVDTLSCESPRISATLRDGDALELGKDNMFILVYFEADPTGTNTYAITFLDKDCEILSQEPMQVGDTYEGGTPPGAAEPARITLVSAYDNLVEVEISLPLIVSGDLNQGESLVFSYASSEVQVLLDDLSVTPANEPPSAILSFIVDDVLVKHLDAQEGKAEVAVPDVMSVRAAEVAAGYTFGAKWATIEVFYCGEAYY